MFFSSLSGLSIWISGTSFRHGRILWFALCKVVFLGLITCSKSVYTHWCLFGACIVAVQSFFLHQSHLIFFPFAWFFSIWILWFLGWLGRAFDLEDIHMGGSLVQLFSIFGRHWCVKLLFFFLLATLKFFRSPNAPRLKLQILAQLTVTVFIDAVLIWWSFLALQLLLWSRGTVAVSSGLKLWEKRPSSRQIFVWRWNETPCHSELAQELIFLLQKHVFLVGRGH